MFLTETVLFIVQCVISFFSHRSFYVQLFPIFLKLKVIRSGKGIIGKLVWERDGGEEGKEGEREGWRER